MGKYLDILKKGARDRSDISDKSRPAANRSVDFGRFGLTPERFCQAAFTALERRCAEHVDHQRWRQVIDDGRQFLAQWGEKAAALGWRVRDLFGLAAVPPSPAPNYARLSRYEQTGLIWLLEGRVVVALTEETAAIETATGAISIYRRYNKPALGPLGDSWDDMG
jgi:hypothetical protein